MAKHRFDGRWNYSEMPDGADVATPGRPMILAIPDENDGQVDEDHSSHAGFKVDGEVSDTRVDLVRTGPGTHKRALVGTVVFDQRCGEVNHIVIVGKYIDDPPDTAATAQNEGTWVVSKP